MNTSPIPISYSVRPLVGLRQLTKDDIMKIGHIGAKDTVKRETLNKLFDDLIKAMDIYQINTPIRIAHFLAQIMVESDYFGKLEESSNYSSSRLKVVFSYFKKHPVKANELGMHGGEQSLSEGRRRRILDYAYNGSNGNASSGDDGWNYRGRGLMQLTGRTNYQAFKEKTGVDFINYPDLIATVPQWAVESATWYWSTHQGNYYADKDEFTQVTYKVNGGFNGYDDRLKVLNNAKMTLGLSIDNLWVNDYGQNKDAITAATKLSRKNPARQKAMNLIFQ